MAKKALHSQSYGGRGCKVRVYEPREGANFMIAPFIAGRYHPKSLGHRDVKKAEAAAYALIAQLQNGKRQTTEPSKLTLKALVELYLSSESYKTLKPQQRAEKQANLERIVAYFGPAKLVTALDEDAVTGLLTARREGTNGFGKAGQQTVYKCFSDLKSVILWALKKKNAAGARILLENPIAGMDVRPNKTPSQPIISHDTFVALRRAARKKLPPYIRVFLIVAEGTGRRAGAVRNLEWRDVDLEAGSILWRGETDKMGHEMHRPCRAASFCTCVPGSSTARRRVGYSLLPRTHPRSFPRSPWTSGPVTSTRRQGSSVRPRWAGTRSVGSGPVSETGTLSPSSCRLVAGLPQRR